MDIKYTKSILDEFKKAGWLIETMESQAIPNGIELQVSSKVARVWSKRFCTGKEQKSTVANLILLGIIS